MIGWGDFFVILAVGAAAAWCIRWVRSIWNRSGAPCACDRGGCPAVRKIETQAKTAADEQKRAPGRVAPSEEEPPLSD